MEANWISVKDHLPENGVTVLAVKELKDKTRSLALAYCNRNWDYFNPVTQEHHIGDYWVCGGNNNIIYWMPLPKLPEEVSGDE